MKEVERLRKEMQEEDEDLDLYAESDRQDLDNPGFDEGKILEVPTQSAILTPVSAPPSPTVSNISTSPNQPDVDEAQPSRSEAEDLPSVATSLLDEETLPKRRRKTPRRQNMDATGSKDLPDMTLNFSNDSVLQSKSTVAGSSSTVESKRDKRRARQQAKKEAEPNNDEHLVYYSPAPFKCHY